MKRLSKSLLLLALLFSTQIAFAQVATEENYASQETSATLKKIAKYLSNLGAFLGYNIGEQGNAPTPYAKLLNEAAMQVKQNYVFNTLLGAIMVNTSDQDAANFVPSSNDYQAVNGFANYTFRSQPYDNASGNQQGKISVSKLIDQENFQKNPVSQSLLNILATPSHTFCMNYQETVWDKNCQLLYDYKVSENVIGELPKPREFFSYDYNQTFLSQLNSDALIAPLMYETNTPASSGSSPIAKKEKAGLTADNQAQLAANFVRYAAYLVEPLSSPSYKQYSTTYRDAKNSSGNVSKSDQKKAEASLAKYFSSLRIYTAHASVGLSNLYYILSRRMPQNQSASDSKTSSQALSEFTMASWRLYNPDLSANKQWLGQINNASSASVQKEIATLLAEINYQMYLNRQQQERLLLTESILLLQNTKGAQPNNNLKNQLRD